MKLSGKVRINSTMAYLLLYGIAFLSHTRAGELYRDGMVASARDGDARTISLLPTMGADLSRVSSEEHLTPLGAAAQAGHADIVASLLREGARVNELDDHQETALTIANRSSQTEIAKLLKAAGGYEHTYKRRW